MPMGHQVTVDVPDELYDELNEQARAAGATPGEYITRHLPQLVRRPDSKLRRHFGSVSMGRPLFRSNEEIDEALAREYGSKHDEEV